MRTKVRRKTTKAGVRWYVSTVNDDGTEEAHGGHATKREATKAAAAIVTDAGRGRYVSPATLTVADYLLGEWLPSRGNAEVSVNTRDLDRTIVEAYVLPHIGTTGLQKLTARDLDRLYAALRDHGGRGGKPLRGKTVRNVHGLLSKALGDAVRRGHLVVNPILAVDPPARDDSVERAAWTKAEVRRFLDTAATDRLGAIWRLALATGCRRGELLGIQWADVDLGTCTVSVARQVLVRPRSVADSPRVYVRETTKTRRVRHVRFDPETAATLKRWKAAQDAERLAFGAAWHEDGGLGAVAEWVVTEPDGSVIHPDTLLARFKGLVKVAGVASIGLHGARHSYATLALEAGVRLDVVSRQLGHASISTTGNIYAHDSDEAAAGAALLVAGVLGGVTK